MTNKSLIVIFDDQKCQIYNKSECQIRGKPKVSATKQNDVYKLDKNKKDSKIPERTVAMTTVVSKDTWHRRLEHLSQKRMKMLKEGFVTGIKYSETESIEKLHPMHPRKTK